MAIAPVGHVWGSMLAAVASMSLITAPCTQSQSPHRRGITTPPVRKLSEDRRNRPSRPDPVTRLSKDRRSTLLITHGASVAYSPSGKQLAAGLARGGEGWAIGEVWMWDLRTRTLKWRVKADPIAVQAVAFSPDGKVVASGNQDGTIRAWDAATGAHRWTLRGHQGPVVALAFSPTGRTLASGSNDFTARIWDVGPRTVRHVLRGHKTLLLSVAFSPDGKAIATGTMSGDDEGEAKLWDAATGTLRRRLRAKEFTHIHSLAFTPDGKTLIAGSVGDSRSDYRAAVVLWDLGTGEPRSTLDVTGAVTNMGLDVAVSPDGRVLAAGSVVRMGNSVQDGIQLWDARTLKPIRHLALGRHYPADIAFAPDGAKLASIEINREAIAVWSVPEERLDAVVSWGGPPKR